MKFAVIQLDDDFVQCIGICEEYLQAVGRAYDYATELITTNEEGKGSVTPLYELEGQTGLGITVHYAGNLEAKIFILSHEDEVDKQ